MDKKRLLSTISRIAAFMMLAIAGMIFLIAWTFNAMGHGGSYGMMLLPYMIVVAGLPFMFVGLVLLLKNEFGWWISILLSIPILILVLFVILLIFEGIS